MEYRHSHLAKGDTYDASIATQPFDAYMAKYEEEYPDRHRAGSSLCTFFAPLQWFRAALRSFVGWVEW